MSARDSFFSLEDAMRFLPREEVSIYNRVTKERTYVPMDPYFPAGGVYLPEEQLQHTLGFVWPLKFCSQRVIVGQKNAVTYTIGGYCATGDHDLDHRGFGHVLFAGDPGTGKSLYGGVLSRLVDGLTYGRFQGMPDNVPGDYFGERYLKTVREKVSPEILKVVSEVGISNETLGKALEVLTHSLYGANTHRDFVLERGPVYSLFQHIDEINRNPAKTLAALLEVMSEGQVTRFDETEKVNAFIFATMNDRESEGRTVSEIGRALWDRFMFVVKSTAFISGEYKEIVRRAKYFSDIELPIVGGLERAEAARTYFHHSITESEQMEDLADAFVMRINAPWAYPAIRTILENDPKTHLLATKVLVGRNREDYLRASLKGRGALHLKGARQIMAMYNFRSMTTPSDLLKVSPYVCAHRMEFEDAVLRGYSVAYGIRRHEVYKRDLSNAITNAAFIDAHEHIVMRNGR